MPPKSAIATILAMTGLGMFDGLPPSMPEVEKPRKKCLLRGCDLPAEPGKLFCGKEHFGEFKKAERAARKGNS